MRCVSITLTDCSIRRLTSGGCRTVIANCPGLANQLARIARADRSTRDYTLNTLRLALAEVISAFPVYRTYIAEKVAPEDRRYIEWAVGRAKRHSRAADATIFDFVKATLLCEP